MSYSLYLQLLVLLAVQGRRLRGLTCVPGAAQAAALTIQSHYWLQANVFRKVLINCHMIKLYNI